MSLSNESVAVRGRRSGTSASGLRAADALSDTKIDPADSRQRSGASDSIKLTLPLDRGQLKDLHAGDACTLTGPLFTLRDAGHMRLIVELDEAGSDDLPYGLSGQAIFYAGPSPESAGRPFGAIGPTTASRMD